jgi:hypothetical protein
MQAGAAAVTTLQQQGAIHRKRDDVAAFYAGFAGLDAVLQVKPGVTGLVAGA